MEQSKLALQIRCSASDLSDDHELLNLEPYDDIDSLDTSQFDTTSDMTIFRHGGKNSYLASIESLADALDDESDVDDATRSCGINSGSKSKTGRAGDDLLPYKLGGGTSPINRRPNHRTSPIMNHKSSPFSSSSSLSSTATLSPLTSSSSTLSHSSITTLTSCSASQSSNGKRFHPFSTSSSSSSSLSSNRSSYASLVRGRKDILAIDDVESGRGGEEGGIRGAGFDSREEECASEGVRKARGELLSKSSSSSSQAMISHSSSRQATLDDDRDDSNSCGHRSNYWVPNLSHVERVIMEIVETERTYVQDLHEIIEGYLIYFKELIQQEPAGERKSFIDDDQLSNLFGNIEDIFRFNSSFLSHLEGCGMGPGGIAKCFVNHSEGFDVYTQYCTNYPRTVSLLTDLMKNKETAKIFRDRQLHLKHSLPLGSYLLKPVQRILKYHLLLQNIVKDNITESQEIDDIRNALSVMTDIGSHINEMKRKHEHAVRVQEIQSLLLGWTGQDLTTYGELVAESSFRMLGAKAFRHLFLFDKMLLVTKKKEDGALSYKAHIMCSNLMLIESIKGEPLCFQTIPFDLPRVQYTFQSRNIDQKREWCLHLKRLMMDNFNAPIPSTAKQIVLGMGQSSPSSGDTSFKYHGSGRKILSAPEYLERRKQERRKSDTISHSLHKGFKLRKSLKKIHPFDHNNGSKRTRSASHDETAMNLVKDQENKDRRCSLGTSAQQELKEESVIATNNIYLDRDRGTEQIIEAKTTATGTITTATISTISASAGGIPATCERDSDERILGLRRSSSRCSRRFAASDCIKRASISEAFADDYFQLYFSPGNISQRPEIMHNSGTSCEEFSTNSLRKRSGLPVGLSSGSSELSMASMGSLTPSEDSINCICRAYRQLNLRSTPVGLRLQLHSSSSSSSAGANVSPSPDQGNASANEYLTEDTLIPCLCGSNCEKSKYALSSNSHYYNSNHSGSISSGCGRDDSGISSISSRSSYSIRTSTPLSSGSSELSMASSANSEDYRNINATIALLDNPNSVVRRVQSFTGMVKAKAAIIQHTLSFRHSPALDLPVCNLNKHRPSVHDSGVVMSSSGASITGSGESRNATHSYSFSSISSRDSSTTRLASSTSLEEIISPTSPAAWLRKQEQHFPPACKKGGSLPRSFETSAFANCNL